MAGRDLVSVVLPVRDEARHLAEQLRALAAQDYDGAWELVVVDNGSRDGSAAIARAFADRVPGLRLVSEPVRGVNRARNRGLAEARGEIVAFCDADDVATPGWLGALVDALDASDIAAGPLDLEALNGPVQRAWRNQTPWTEKRDERGRYLHVPGGNVAMRTDLARSLGWDPAFAFGASDGEFFWRAQRLGLGVAEAPGAVMRLRYPATLPELFRQFLGYGAGEPLLHKRQRDDGYPRRGLRAALRAWASLVLRCGDLVRSPERRGRWVRDFARLLGRVAGSVRHRVLYL